MHGGMSFIVHQIAEKTPISLGNDAAANAVLKKPMRQIGPDARLINLFPEDFVLADLPNRHVELIDVQMNQRLPCRCWIARIGGRRGIGDQREFPRRRLRCRVWDVRGIRTSTDSGQQNNGRPLSYEPSQRDNRLDQPIQPLIPIGAGDVNRRSQANHILGREIDHNASLQTRFDQFLRRLFQFDSEHQPPAAHVGDFCRDLFLILQPGHAIFAQHGRVVGQLSLVQSRQK